MAIASIYTRGDGGSVYELPFNIFKVKTQPTSKIISAPVEDGIEVPDMKVRMPKVIVVTVTIVNETRNGYTASQLINTINKMYEERELKFYHIHDGIADHPEDFILQDAPHERGVKEFDFLNYELTFKEVMRISGKEQRKPYNSENSDSRNWGYQEPEEDVYVGL